MEGKSHRVSKVGRKADKKKAADKKKRGISNEKKQNPKAFAFQSAGKAKAQQARTAEREQRRLHGERARVSTRPWGGFAAGEEARRCSTTQPHDGIRLDC